MYRDDRHVCPRCSEEVALEPAGQRLTCRACGGVLVPTAEVESMVAEMLAIYEQAILPNPARDSRRPPRPVAPPPPSLMMPGTLPCPRCGIAMDLQRLGEQEVDHCREHGYWFDGRELSLVLERMGGVVPSKPRSPWHWLLTALFNRTTSGASDISKPDDI